MNKYILLIPLLSGCMTNTRDPQYYTPLPVQIGIVFLVATAICFVIGRSK